jgi:hypothetical protein
MTKTEARKRVCPFHGEYLIRQLKCIADDCMAWESSRGRCLRIEDPDPALVIGSDGQPRRL